MSKWGQDIPEFGDLIKWVLNRVKGDVNK
ncbi:hypothetical protein EYZ11_000597 [Aspergillus tanneri]|uniref:Uncharacterized protein n=1 Tax=Aspergillus tanneri TaxID=1220188 RepID=A0A4S3JWM8_9EURO|nr:hypothetical protein EYZ11_000597 [Aspergillus tanneri]